MSQLMNKFLLTILLALVLKTLSYANFKPVVIEAEAASLGSSLAIGTEGVVQYVYPTIDKAGYTPGDTKALLTFTVRFPEVGVYHLYARFRVGNNNYGDDSFFFAKRFGVLNPAADADWCMVNGVVPNGYVAKNDVVGYQGSAGINTWKWLNVSAFYNQSEPVSFSVVDTGIPYVFQWASREDGFDLDKIAFCLAGYQYTVENLESQQPGQNPQLLYTMVESYVNPVLPGDHPDPTLLRVGDDFYTSSSSFHFTPYAPIYHSKDLLHWKLISRVVPASWSGLLSDAPAAGTWGGTLTYFYDAYWYYFSNTAGGGQYFCKATTPLGPWSAPVKVKTTADTGPVGYDNSIFVDDDGTPYMLIKPGQFVNRIQRIGTDGHLTGSVINMDWVNSDKKYSWAEGPVMCKRDGWYYYFIAGNVGGGQYVLRSRTLTADSTRWEALGNFFESVTDPAVYFRSPNHIAQPFSLDDGTWWTIAHAYEGLGSDSWEGKGRQGLLIQMVWDESGKPTGKAPTTLPMTKPALSKNDYAWRLPRSDEFNQSTLALDWYSLNRKAAAAYSLVQQPGWIALLPGTDSCHLLQRDAGHFYSMTTKVAVKATKRGDEAGLCLTNGTMSQSVRLTSTYAANSRVIAFRFSDKTYEVPNTVGDTVWLKMERAEHLVAGFYSADGLTWTQIGVAMDVTALDKGQVNYNSWVGNSMGLFAKGCTAHFDRFAYRDGFSDLSLGGRDTYHGVEVVTKASVKSLTNTSALGGWCMLGGVQVGWNDRKAIGIELVAAAAVGGTVEVWLDDIERSGTKIAELVVLPTGGVDAWTSVKAVIPPTSGQHDLYLRFKGSKNAVYLKSLRFYPDEVSHTVQRTTQQVVVYPNPSRDVFFIASESIQQATTYRIVDLQGRLMERGVVSDQGIGATLPSGFYVLDLETPQENAHRLLIKQ